MSEKSLLLPQGLAHIAQRPQTKMTRKALELYGTKETRGTTHTPEIMAWAKELNIKVYTSDEIPWCGLFMDFLSHCAEKPRIKDPLWALNWQNWGQPSAAPKFGDTLVFKRKIPTGWAGHVGLYWAESKNYYYVLGGNTDDKVGFAKIHKDRFVAARQSYKVTPDFCIPIFVDDASVNLKISVNEA